MEINYDLCWEGGFINKAAEEMESKMDFDPVFGSNGKGVILCFNSEFVVVDFFLLRFFKKDFETCAMTNGQHASTVNSGWQPAQSGFFAAENFTGCNINFANLALT